MTETPPTPDAVPPRESGWFKAGGHAFFTLRAADVQRHRLCDDLSGMLILVMLVFSPWAFGTTQPWAIWCMNGAEYGLGALLLMKLFIRQARGYVAPRWENFSPRTGALTRRPSPATRRLRRVLAGLTLAVLAECLISALNAAANYNVETRVFEYQPHLAWLPHSFDGHRTWFYFWMYLGLAGAFWAVGDWLAGMTCTEERRLLIQARSGSPAEAPLLPARLRSLLWLLCLNGAVLGVEAIVQRAAGSSRLLFWLQPRVNPGGETQFGPYAYRSNAAQYFNLVWPLSLGFWLTLRHAGGRSAVKSFWLLLSAAIMAACPVISTSRAGALVAGGMLLAALLYVGWSSLFLPDASRQPGPSRWGTAGGMLLFLIVAVALGWHFGWDPLFARLEAIGGGYEGRERMYAAAQPMARDYPLFGTGPGTFATVFQLYRYSYDTFWPEQLHNDWLETLITFGWLGLGLLLAALAVVGLRWLAPGRSGGDRRLAAMAWLALGGCLVEARFDFPFQVHSTLFLFLVICAILFNLRRHPGAARPPTADRPSPGSPSRRRARGTQPEPLTS